MSQTLLSGQLTCSQVGQASLMYSSLNNYGYLGTFVDIAYLLQNYHILDLKCFFELWIETIERKSFCNRIILFWMSICNQVCLLIK